MKESGHTFILTENVSVPGWMGLWASWSSGKCPRPWQECWI